MKTYTGQTYIKTVLTLILLFGIGFYAYSKSIDFTTGPQIIITSPENGQTVTEPVVEIVGSALNVSDITLNGAPIFITESGAFSERLLLSVGYNIITLQAHDKFNRNNTKVLELVYK